jgi:hypothetical protein
MISVFWGTLAQAMMALWVAIATKGMVLVPEQMQTSAWSCTDERASLIDDWRGLTIIPTHYNEKALTENNQPGKSMGSPKILEFVGSDGIPYTYGRHYPPTSSRTRPETSD